MTIRINLWSGPRNISTALMYSFAQRSDTTVVDEPLYAHYLRRTPASEYHPGAGEVLASQDADGSRVIERVILGPSPTPVIFFKQMTHHLVDLALDFLDETVNVLLTRDPRDMLRSYVHQVEDPTLADTGYPQLVELLDELRLRGQEPPVLEARAVLDDPPKVLSELCRRIGIDFEPGMLSWPAGPRPEDGVWAPHWYASVHRSTGFRPYSPAEGPFPDRLRPLLDEAVPLYERVAASAIR